MRIESPEAVQNILLFITVGVVVLVIAGVANFIVARQASDQGEAIERQLRALRSLLLEMRGHRDSEKPRTPNDRHFRDASQAAGSPGGSPSMLGLPQSDPYAVTVERLGGRPEPPAGETAHQGHPVLTFLERSSGAAPGDSRESKTLMSAADEVIDRAEIATSAVQALMQAGSPDPQRLDQLRKDLAVHRADAFKLRTLLASLQRNPGTESGSIEELGIRVRKLAAVYEEAALHLEQLDRYRDTGERP